MIRLPQTVLTDDPIPTDLAPTLALLPWPPRRALDELHDAGFRAVQLSGTQPGLRPRELGSSARRDLVAALRRREIVAAGIDAWIPCEHFLDAARVERATDAVAAIIELAADLGRIPVSVNLPRPRGEQPAPSADEAIRVLADAAQRAGVALADHALPLPSSEAVAVGIDPVACIVAGADLVALIDEAGPRLASARLSDIGPSGARGPVAGPAGGRLDLPAYRSALQRIGYRGQIVVDARDWPEPWEGVLVTARAWAAVRTFATG